MWILLLTWVSLEPNLAKLGEPMARLNSKVLYSYETEVDCNLAREWVLENNEPSKNPTMKSFCLKRRDIESPDQDK